MAGEQVQFRSLGRRTFVSFWAPGRPFFLSCWYLSAWPGFQNLLVSERASKWGAR